MKKYWLVLLAIILLPNLSFAANPWPASSGVDISSQLLFGTPTYEPSGLIWHKTRNSLITVWAGLITEMDQNGNILHECYSSDPTKDLNCGTYYDFEGVTVADYNTNNIYLGVENPDSILEFDISTGTYTGKAWTLTSWMTGADNSGLEGLTFVPNSYHPYANSSSGGLFYASLQETGELFVFDVNLASSGIVTKIDQFTPVSGRTDASDLFFNEETELLYIMYDSADHLTEMRLDRTIDARYDYDSMPGSNEEGFAMISSYPNSTATVFIGHDDSHNISIHTGYPVTYLDSDLDGYANYVDCNDASALIKPGATETCNSIDDNCNGFTDDGLATITYYIDADSDGYGHAFTSVSSCYTSVAGYVNNSSDCDDALSTIYASQTFYQDLDGDGLGNSNVSVSECVLIKTGYVANNNDNNDNDYDNDGYAYDTDCDDRNSSLTVNHAYYRDADNDTYGAGTSESFCLNNAPLGYVSNNADCDDTLSAIHSVQIFYQDVDGDGLGNNSVSVSECALTKDGYVTNNSDTNDCIETIDNNIERIIKFRGMKNGKIRVKYINSTISVYRVFKIKTNKLTKVSRYKNTDYLKVKNPINKKVAYINGLTGQRIGNIAKIKKIAK